MVLIFGGAYQGKLDFAKSTLGVTDADILTCGEDVSLDFSKKVFYNFELFILKCVDEGLEAKEVLASKAELFKDKIFIVNDISQGIVPMEPRLRAWREMVGRTMLYLSAESKSVYRVFCGIGQCLK